MPSDAPASSPWAPLRQPVFRALWVAGLASDFGAWMHEVGEGWLMTSLSASPLNVALLQAADSLAVFLLAVPAGALADVVDRRRLGIVTQAWLVVGAALLGAFALAHRMTPARLIVLTFAMGIGAALDTPLWQAIVAEVVPRRDLPRAVTLGGLSINLARAFAPALGGFVVAAAGPFAVFFLNAVTFALVIVVLARWRREQPRAVAPAEKWFGALQGGLRYARHSPQLVAAFARAAATLFGGICLLALMPSFARRTLGLGSVGFGMLLGCMGVGAVSAAWGLSKLDGKVRADVTLSAGTVVLGASLVCLAAAPGAALAAPAMFVAGFAWMSVISSLNVEVQMATPSWVRARVSAVFMLVFQGALVLGAVVWGATAARTSVRVALVCGGAATLASVVVRAWFPLWNRAPDFSPAVWPKPLLVCEPSEDAGPVLVTVTYRVAPAKLRLFVDAMRDLEHVRRREGAYDWRLYRDAALQDTYIEAYAVDSWGEHLRQHARVTEDERKAELRAEVLTIEGSERSVRHLISVDAVTTSTSSGPPP
jgi:MFS family permease